MSLPSIFLERLKKIIPAECYAAVVDGFSKTELTCIRINLLRTSTEAALAELAQLGVSVKPCAWRQDAFVVKPEHRDLLTSSPAFAEGRIAIQNFSSMVPVMMLNPQPNEEILDLAAAPGGKTALMAMMMQNTGRIAAVEVVKNRFFKMKSQLDILGVTNVETYLKDGREVGRQCPERFDGVLLDAPCSSEARFSIHDPASYAYWSERKVSEMQHKQKRLLVSALQSVKVGGVVVYSTCSYSPEENEIVINHALKKLGDAIQVLPISLPFENIQQGLTHWQNKTLLPSINNAIRILPTDEMEGFFVCCLRKVSAI
jgi:NOL1/NOP2/sun family putative RNA methylase